MAITQAELARHWNISPQAVTKHLKNGCPLTSLRRADRWRDSRPRPREGKNCKSADTEHEDGVEPQTKKRVGRPLNPRPMVKTGDSLLDALNAAIAVQERAYEQFDKAMCEGIPSRIAPLLHVHTKALEGRFMAEKAYREEAERRNILVDKTVMTEVCRRTMEPVLRDLKKLPNESGPQCGADPLQNVKILEIAVNRIIAKGRVALTDALKS